MTDSKRIKRNADSADGLSPLAWGVLLYVAVALAFIPALFAGFIWDDDAYVLNNVHLRSLQGLPEIWFNLRATPQYYPLVHTTYWLEYRLWGLDPAGYHAANVLLHAGNAVLLWLVLRTLQVPGAWLAAAVFGVHPVQVESVAWITERKNVLSGLFYLGSALLYLRWRAAGFIPAGGAGGDKPRRSRAKCLAACLLFLAALLSKTVTASLPAALALVLWWKQGRVTRRDWLTLLPMFVVGILFGVLTARLEREHVGASGPEWDFSFLERCLIASRAAWFYLAKLLWPFELTFIYPRWHIDTSSWPQYVYLVAALALVLGLWLVRRRIGAGPLVAILFFGGTLLPALGFLNVYPMRYSFVADHFQYLACIGPITLAARGLTHIATRFSFPEYLRVATSLPLLGTLWLLTWMQCHSYLSLEQLWQDTLQKNPDAAIAHHGLGFILDVRAEQLAAAGDTEAARASITAAETHYRKAVALDPRCWEALLNLGILQLQQQRHDEAIANLRQAAAIVPGQVNVRNALGDALFRSDKYEAALAEFETSLSASPHQPAVHKRIAEILVRQNRNDAAIEQLHEALRLDPDYQPARELVDALRAKAAKAP